MLGAIVRSIRTALRFMGTEIMSKESHSASGIVGPRGVRLALVSSGLLFMVLLGAWAAIETAAMYQQGHPVRSALLAMVALLLLLLTWRVIGMNWRAMDTLQQPPGAPPDGSDQTGIWGVGGPSMREPGSTGVWPARNVDRRYEDRDD